jgi:hypothetical protein
LLTEGFLVQFIVSFLLYLNLNSQFHIEKQIDISIFCWFIVGDGQKNIRSKGTSTNTRSVRKDMELGPSDKLLPKSTAHHARSKVVRAWTFWSFVILKWPGISCSWYRWLYIKILVFFFFSDYRRLADSVSYQYVLIF